MSLPIVPLGALLGTGGVWIDIETAGCGVANGLEIGPGEEDGAAVPGKDVGVCAGCKPIGLPQALQNFFPSITSA